MIIVMRIVGATRILAALLLAAGGASAQELTVISHVGTALSATDVKDVFLGEKQFAGSTKLVPVDNSAAQEGLISRVLRMNPSKYSSVWTKKSFRDGTNPPPVRSGDAATLEFVKVTPGAVGYVTGGPTAGVNVVGKY